MPSNRKVILALGNRFRGDDAVGPVVADRLRQDKGARLIGCDIIEGCDDAMALVSAWEDAALAIVIDAMISGEEPGSIRRLDAGEQPLPKDWARCSSHGLGLAEAVELGRALGQLPARLIIFGVEAKTLETGALLSAEVAAAIDKLARQIKDEIASFAAVSETDA